MSEPDTGKTGLVLPIRDGLELTCDVQREALDYFKAMLAEYGGPEMIGLCFTIHETKGRCTAFCYAAPDQFPHALLEAQAAIVLANAARADSAGQG